MTITTMDLILRPHLAELVEEVTDSKDSECWRSENEIKNWYARYRSK
jgi:hypothetical protein